MLKRLKTKFHREKSSTKFPSEKHYISFKRLLHMKRNLVKDQQQGIVNLPFIVIRTDKNTNVECSVSSDE
ncbi:hypothetical protein AC249_AIPGENE10377 [Exaiptasia diaphana]|nr:hypothetical protein AC249_AIPGENE10377 [Exaiptasia diaphana]